jgi:hypothetical protein
LARRFSIIGNEYNFRVIVNGEEISVKDRDYYDKVEYAWLYGENDVYSKQMTTVFELFQRQNEFDVKYPIAGPDSFKVEKVSVQGWIGTVEKPSNLKDVGDENLNRIVLLVRGKLAQEDILSDFSEGGIFASYIIGEIEADFLDDDFKEDVATSNRQRVIEDDPRYLALSEFIFKEFRNIKNKWTELRNNRGILEALEIPSIQEWYGMLGSGEKRKAESLFGKIKALTVESPEERGRLYKFSVLAFESLRLKGNLEALDNVTTDNITELIPLFQTMDDLEATLYRQIVQQRLGIIKALEDKVEEDAKEKVLQRYLFDHLWLLDPSWERATSNPFMEKSLLKLFDDVNVELAENERKGRVDIKYRTTSGKHVIIELKKAGRKIDSADLLKQIRKYQNGIRKILDGMNKTHEPVEFVCVLGSFPTDWTDEMTRDQSEGALRQYDARIVLYDELISNAYDSYKSFLSESEKAGHVTDLIGRIEKEVMTSMEDQTVSLPITDEPLTLSVDPVVMEPITLSSGKDRIALPLVLTTSKEIDD